MFERQFYIGKKDRINEPLEGFQTISIRNWIIAIQEKNYYSKVKNEFFDIHIVGCIAHPDYQDVKPKSFAQEVLGKCKSFEEINSALYKACGRFVVVIAYDNDLIIRSDAVSLGQVYFDSKQEIICSDIRLYEYLVKEREDNYSAKLFHKNTMPYKGNGDAWIGDDTIYLGLKKLLPNHALYVSGFKVERYWPVKQRRQVRLKDCLYDIASQLKSTLQAFQNIAPLSIAVTAGNDSRLMLAASLALKQKCRYFIINHPKMKNGDVDIVIGKRLCDIAGVPYRIYDIRNENEVPTDFKRKYFQNSFFAKNERLPVVYKYYQDFSGYINICGVGEYGRSVFGNGILPVSANFLCHKYHYTNSNFANQMTKKWLKEYKHSIRQYGYNTFAMFYIEQKLGNWGAVGNTESDLAFEEVNPYASHYLIHKFLSLPKSETTYINNKLFHDLTTFFNKKLLSEPINPVFKNRKKLGKFVKSTFLFPFVDYALYLLKSARLKNVD